PGRSWFSIPWFHISVTFEGLQRGLFYSLRMLNLLALAGLFTLTTSPLSLADSLERLLAPFKRLGIPAHEVGMTLSISLRFIPILIDEADCIQKSQTSRGADWSGNPLNRIRGLLSIFVPLLVSSLRQANDLALAMDSRCYRGGKGRTSFQSLKMGKRDWTAIAVVLGCAAVCVGLDYQWP
ncbi:MAG TPA: energy-coupling factor transporter transmembrane component T, partial [bacterium]